MVEGAFSGVYSGSFSTPEIVDVSSSPRSGLCAYASRSQASTALTARGSSAAIAASLGRHPFNSADGMPTIRP